MILIGPYVIDAALNETDDLEAEISEFPVEQGISFTDNVRIKPRTYQLDGVVSDTPLDLGFRAIEDDGTPLLDTSTRASAQAKTALEALYAAGQPIKIVTSLATYTDMVIKKLSFAQDGETGDALPFTASLQQILIVQNVRRAVRIKFSAVNRGLVASTPPFWIGRDALGRDVFVDPDSKGPGLKPRYLRADGTPVSDAEASSAARRTGSVLVQYDKDGKAIPIAKQDFQPATPRQQKPFWSPQQR